MRDRAVDAAIVEALPHLDRATASVLLDLLVNRNHGPSQAALVATFCDMVDPLGSLVVERAMGLHEGIRLALRSDDRQTRRAGIALIIAAKDASSSHLLADALRRKCSHTRELAATGLLELSRHYCTLVKKDSQETVRYAHLYRAHLRAALTDAVSNLDIHHQRPALEAALYLGDAVQPALLRKLKDPNSPIGFMVTTIIEETRDPRLAGFLLRALAIEPLRRSAAAAIKKATDAAFVASILHQSWLLADPAIRQGCRWLKDGEWSKKWCDAITGRNAAFASTAIDFMSAFGGTPDQRMLRMSSLLEASNESVRRDVFWRLVADESGEATSLLVNISRRDDEPLCELAQLECQRRRNRGGIPDSPPLQKGGNEQTDQATTPNASVTTPGQVLERFFGDFDQLSPADRQSLGDQIMSLVGNLPERLNKYARSSDAMIRARTVRMAIELGLVDEMSETLYALAHDPTGSVRAVAISSLRTLPGATTTRILRDALRDPEPRVQANAVEVLEAMGLTDGGDLVSPKLDSQNNRVRANAVKALLGMQFAGAADALLDMLKDDSQAHRISALWVIERMRLRTLLDRITEMSQVDPDARVRDRAVRVLRAFGTLKPTGPSTRQTGAITYQGTTGIAG